MATAGGSSLKFVVEIATDQATQGLQALQTAVNQAGGSIRTSFSGIGPAARAAGHEVEGLGSKISAFARGERGERRIASFFVRDIAEIVPISKEAKFALTDLGGAMLGGGALGMGIAAAAVTLGGIASIFHEIGTAAEEAERKMVKAAEEARKGWGEMRSSAQAFLRDLNPNRTKAEKWLEGQNETYDKQLEAARGELAKAQSARGPLGGYAGASFWQYQSLADYKAARQLDDEIKRLTNSIIDLEAKKTTAQRVFTEQLQPAEAVAAREARYADYKKAADAATAAAASKDFEERLRRQEASEERTRALQSEIKGVGDYTEVRKIQIEEEKKLAALDDQRRKAKGAELAALGREREALVALYTERLRLAGIKEQFESKGTATQQWGTYDKETGKWSVPEPETTPRAGGTEDEGQDLSRTASQVLEAHRLKTLQKEQEEYKRKLRETTAEYERFGNTAAHTLAGLVTGTMSGAQAIDVLISTVVEQSLQYMAKLAAAEMAKSTTETALNTKRVAENSAVAGSGAVAQGAPYLGPWALAVGVALAAAVLSTFAIAGSAAKGARIPEGLNPLFQLHGGEHVIPANIARRYERGAPDAGMTALTINAIDAAGVEKLFRKNGRALVRALDRQARRARA